MKTPKISKRLEALDRAVRVNISLGGHENPEVTVKRAVEFEKFLEGKSEPVMVGTYGGVPGYSGWIEPADKSWIIYLDSEGTPNVYYPRREETGAVIGKGQQLSLV